MLITYHLAYENEQKTQIPKAPRAIITPVFKEKKSEFIVNELMQWDCFFLPPSFYFSLSLRSVLRYQGLCQYCGVALLCVEAVVSASGCCVALICWSQGCGVALICLS